MIQSKLLVFGLNHQSAPVAMRERLAYAENEIVPALLRLKRQAPSLSEAALLSTCNRVEIIGAGADTQQATEESLLFLARDRAVSSDTFREVIYHFEGRSAARHLFRVGASLDSMVVGEPQILGQVKAAYEHAAEAGTAGLVLHRVFHKAFSVAKHVRKATLIGHGAVSLSSAAVSLAGKIFDSLNDKTVMLMGAGKMAELTARSMKRLGIETLLITSRTFDNAVGLARELGGTAVPYDNLKPHLKMADIIIGSLAVREPVLNTSEFETVVRERRYRPIFLIDLGVPRNFDERLNSLENVYLYDIDDLGKVALESREERELEALRAEPLVELEVDSFMRWLDGLELVPAIKDIRSSIEELRTGELARHRAWLAGLEPAERDRIESLTRSLVNKLLHRVLSGLRASQNETADAVHTAAVARRLLCSGLNLDHEAEGELERQIAEVLSEDAIDLAEDVPATARKRD
ncbi:MAG TPA: glutamyl-tRNA reductase [Candidatus Binataceae bacterium]|nr:glutamyl-tRNA reductase [Candidatus Binataceae bacterium]